MSDNIKIEGEKKVFEGGAIRYEKRKGRFDLLPGEVIYELFVMSDNIDESNDIRERTDNIIYNPSATYIQKMAYVKDDYLAEKYLKLIILIVAHEYRHNNMTTMSTAVCYMLKDLAKHVQEDAEKYGERNCEKGIPLWSFIDSGLRHLNQYLLGETDEPHHIAAIWNFMYAVWTIMHENDKKSGVDICENLCKEWDLKLEKGILLCDKGSFMIDEGATVKLTKPEIKFEQSDVTSKKSDLFIEGDGAHQRWELDMDRNGSLMEFSSDSDPFKKISDTDITRIYPETSIKAKNTLNDHYGYRPVFDDHELYIIADDLNMLMTKAVSKEEMVKYLDRHRQIWINRGVSMASSISVLQENIKNKIKTVENTEDANNYNSPKIEKDSLKRLADIFNESKGYLLTKKEMTAKNLLKEAKPNSFKTVTVDKEDVMKINNKEDKNDDKGSES